MTTISMLIGGERRQAGNRATFERRNPLDGNVATVAPDGRSLAFDEPPHTERLEYTP